MPHTALRLYGVTCAFARFASSRLLKEYIFILLPQLLTTNC